MSLKQTEHEHIETTIKRKTSTGNYKNEILQEDIDAIIEKFSRGLCILDISEELGLSQPTIRKYIIQHKLDPQLNKVKNMSLPCSAHNLSNGEYFYFESHLDAATFIVNAGYSDSENIRYVAHRIGSSITANKSAYGFSWKNI